MRTSLAELLRERHVLLADGATGTNYFEMGLTSGDAPELWNELHPEKVTGLHRAFVDAGADIILTNSFGGTRQRMKLHGGQDRVRETNARAAALARSVADAADRPVIVAGSVGPTGELFAPLGALTEDEAVDAFLEQIEGLKEGGADMIWIETMSAPEEIRAAATAASRAAMPYSATCSFDTAGRTMMGLLPDAMFDVFSELDSAPSAFGANCGVGASDILVTVLELTKSIAPVPVVVKGNCGVPKFVGTEAVYTGTPEQMAEYVRLAVGSGARIIGGCCGTSPMHLHAMREALDAELAGESVTERPTVEEIVEKIGPLVNNAPSATAESRERRRRRPV